MNHSNSDSTIGDDLRAVLYPLIDEYRTRCLWFLREDYYPDTIEQALRVLTYFDGNGDRSLFLKTREIRKCLSQNSNEKSAV